MLTFLETVLPFLGVTLTVNLQVPAESPLTADPVTLHFLTDDGQIFTETVDPALTVSFAKTAIDFKEAVFLLVTVGILAEVALTSADTIFQGVQFPATSLTRTSNDEIVVLLTPLNTVARARSDRGIEIVVA